MGRPIGSKSKKADIKPRRVPQRPCPSCGQFIHPHFQHHCFKFTELAPGEWTPHGRGAFMVIEYVE